MEVKQISAYMFILWPILGHFSRWFRICIDIPVFTNKTLNFNFWFFEVFVKSWNPYWDMNLGIHIVRIMNLSRMGCADRNIIIKKYYFQDFCEVANFFFGKCKEFVKLLPYYLKNNTIFNMRFLIIHKKSKSVKNNTTWKILAEPSRNKIYKCAWNIM